MTVTAAEIIQKHLKEKYDNIDAVVFISSDGNTEEDGTGTSAYVELSGMLQIIPIGSKVKLKFKSGVPFKDLDLNDPKFFDKLDQIVSNHHWPALRDEEWYEKQGW